MQEEQRLVPPEDLPLPARKDLELRQKRRRVRRPRKQRPPPRLLLARPAASRRAAARQTLLDLVRRRACLQLALGRTTR